MVKFIIAKVKKKMAPTVEEHPQSKLRRRSPKDTPVITDLEPEEKSSDTPKHAEAPAPKPRRRRAPRKPAAASEPNESGDDTRTDASTETVASESTGTQPPSDGEAPRPRRRRSRGGRGRGRGRATDSESTEAKAVCEENSTARNDPDESQAREPRRDNPPRAEGDAPPAPKRRRRRRPAADRKPDPEERNEEAAVAAAAPATPWKLADFNVEPAEGKLRFHDLELPEPIMHAVHDLGFEYASPIQAEILPMILNGQDGLGKAQTGTGKTAAFLITMFTRMLREPANPDRRRGTPRALVVAPTRELAMQIEEEARTLAKYTDINSIAVYGGLDYDKQRRRLRDEHIDLVVATPGRLLDFLKSHDVHLCHVEILVIDEADRMLDMGFIPDVRRIVRATPFRTQRQTLFFSATFNDDVIRLSQQWTEEPVTVEIEPTHVAAETVDQAVYILTDQDKIPFIYNILKREDPRRALIFVNRRDHATRLSEDLNAYGFKSAVLSGAIPQAKRVRTLEAFKTGDLRIVVATDVAGRGIHVDDISHVINFSLPDDPEDYVHRIGRTGRAGSEGKSVSFASQNDAHHIPDIEKFIGHELVCTRADEDWLVAPKLQRRARTRSDGRRGGSSGGRSGGGGRGRSGSGDRRRPSTRR